jgi:hypothetical protein
MCSHRGVRNKVPGRKSHQLVMKSQVHHFFIPSSSLLPPLKLFTNTTDPTASAMA